MPQQRGAPTRQEEPPDTLPADFFAKAGPAPGASKEMTEELVQMIMSKNKGTPRSEVEKALLASGYTRPGAAPGSTAPDSLPASFFQTPPPASVSAPLKTSGQRGMPPRPGLENAPEGPAYPHELPTLVDILPTPRTMFRTGGAAIGGAIGGAGGTILGTPIGGVAGAIAGGASGASIGESMYELGERLRSSLASGDIPFMGATKNTPETGTEAAKEQVGAMISGALQEGVPAAISKYGPSFLRAGAVKKIAQVTRPSTEAEVMATKEAGEKLLEQFPVAATANKLYGKYKTNLSTAGIELERAYNAVPKNTYIRSQPIIAELQKQRDAYLTSIGGNLEAVPGSGTIVKGYNEMIDWFARKGRFNMAELRQNRQVWDHLVNWWKGSLAKEGPQEEVYKATADAARNVINKAFPNIGRANQQVSLWKDVTDVLGKAETNAFTSKDVVESIPFSLAGAAAGLFSGNPSNWGAGVLAGAVAKQILGSTAYKTANIAVRRSVASALERGDVEAAVHFLSAAATGVAQQIGRQFLEPPPGEQ